MYQTGDLVLYGDAGVCKIAEIMEYDLHGGRQLCYALKPLYQEYTIYTPVENKNAALRSVISKESAEELINSIHSMKPEALSFKIVKQHRLTDSSLRNMDCQDLVKLTMSLYAKKRTAEHQKRKMASSEESLMKKAEDLLFGELSVALDVPREQVQSYIVDRVESFSAEEPDIA